MPKDVYEVNGGFPVGNGVGDEFAGVDVPHGCLPDYHFTKCPYLPVNFSNQLACGQCDFMGEFYTGCSSYQIRARISEVSSMGKEFAALLKRQVDESALSALSEDARRNGKFVLEGLRGG